MISKHWKIALALLPIIGTCLAGNYDDRLKFSYCKHGWNGTNAAHDASGRATYATVTTGAILTASGDYYFSGATSGRIESVSGATMMASQTTWTVTFAFCATNPSATAGPALWGEGCLTNSTPYIVLGCNGSNYECTYWTPVGSAGSLDVTITNRIATNGWHFGAMTFIGANTGSAIRLWLDGAHQSQQSKVACPSINSNLNSQCVGILPQKNTYVSPAKNMISDVNGYSPALSDAEINDVFLQWRRDFQGKFNQ